MFETFSYIGSKTQLLPFLKQSMEDYTCKSVSKWDGFGDLLCGTGVVSAYMMKNGCKKVVSNDIQHFAYVITSAYTKRGTEGEFEISKLYRIIGDLNSKMCEIPQSDNRVDNFIYNNYTPAACPPRMYFTESNGLRIDFVRQEIDKMLKGRIINKGEFYILLRILLYAVVKVSNIACVYGAYLKSFKTKAKNDMILDNSHLAELIDGSNHVTYNKKLDHLLSEMEEKCEVVYLDPPYNRRYDNNYHLLETISKYDYPQIAGKTGLRVEGSNKGTTKSTYYSSKHAKDEFKETFCRIKNTQTRFLFTSYSSDGVLSIDQLEDLLKECGFTNIKIYRHDYQKLRTVGDSEIGKVDEYLVACTNT